MSNESLPGRPVVLRKLTINRFMQFQYAEMTFESFTSISGKNQATQGRSEEVLAINC